MSTRRAVEYAHAENIENRRRIIKKLLENGADPKLNTEWGKTSLVIAKQKGQDLPELIRKGRKEYLRTHRNPTAQRGIRGWFSS
jgi:hypothetical protein